MGNPPDDGPCEVTITAPDREWLQGFVRDLVEDRLAAAAHVDMMRTTYRWAGEVHEADEARATLHTDSSCVTLIAERVDALHPYEVACVAAKTIDSGSEPYLRWVTNSTRMPV